MRSAVNQAKQSFNTASGTAASAAENADQVGGSFIPGLEREAANPQGYTPEEMNTQLVASEQGAGGANGGITGQANLQVARSGNSAGYTNALDEAARDKTRQLSENALGIQNKSAQLGQEKQMNAQSQLEKVYGLDTNENLEAQGLADKDTQTGVDASKTGWLQNMEGLITTIGSLKPHA